MEPPPTINKAFSLVNQEEQQHLINTTSSSNSASPASALAVQQSSSSRKTMSKPNFKSNSRTNREHHFCALCGLLGHTVERCYKLHGYPPGFKSSGQRHSSSTSSHKPSNSSSQSPTPQSKPVDSQAMVASQTTFDMTAQCQQLVQLLQSQMNSSKNTSDDFANSYMAGQVYFEDDWQG